MAIRLTQYYIDVGGLVTSGKLRVTRQYVDALTKITSGKLRVTRQYVDALTKITSGKLRVTRQYVDVLVSIPSGTVYNKNASNTINFTQAGHIVTEQFITDPITFVSTSHGIVENQAASNNLVLSALVTTNRVLPVYASSVLSLTSNAFRTIPLTVSNNLVLSTLLTAVKVLPVYTSSTLSLTSKAFRTISLTVSQNILFAQAGHAINVQFITDPITFVSTSHGIVENQVASNNLVLSALVTTNKVLPVYASSVLSLTSNAFRVIPLTVSQNILFAQTWFEFNYIDDRKVGESNLNLTDAAMATGSLSLVQDMALTHSVSVAGPITVRAESDIFLTDYTRNINIYVYANEILLITDSGRIPLTTQHTYDTLTLSQQGYMTFVLQSLLLSQIAVGGRSPGVQIQVISFTQDVKQGGTFRRTINQNIGIGHALTYYEDLPCNKKQYKPFMGENTVPGSKAAPPSSIPNPQFNTYPGINECGDRFLLYWPSKGVRVTTVTIKAPKFGDRDRNAYTRINRETRNGEIIVYADPTWPKVRTMAVTIVGITKADMEAYQSLIYEHLGQLIGLTDWYGNEWEGVITDPNSPAVHDGTQGWTISFKFEGDIIGSYSPGNRLNMNDTQSESKDPGANSNIILQDIVGGARPTSGSNQSLGFVSSVSGVVI